MRSSKRPKNALAKAFVKRAKRKKDQSNEKFSTKEAKDGWNVSKGKMADEQHFDQTLSYTQESMFVDNRENVTSTSNPNNTILSYTQDLQNFYTMTSTFQGDVPGKVFREPIYGGSHLNRPHQILDHIMQWTCTSSEKTE
ncbi:PREDICTED: uncharacterized protein LOC104597029 isoform X1 [Nelumbo nucifera]|uniref:Uncharacterized protein LOC104597029 isoform X1 n=1 Tax=Nelumbo nucifera TaxID=4432 RepID=A0A1U8A4L4_NELNU|nr:PREDICTED: uncharacterized protein LOC104597029 isoform X1 [Nelumbo nucifera]XP_010256725.1 PREDICTED: uncharacterized protein LOC104597029 isoform X1 [Nelumbo nucifera]XP_010256733.1 PREDICTED: uncharacterized protein LOC104597029 isoform X1 [Nelumbo nucifera]